MTQADGRGPRAPFSVARDVNFAPLTERHAPASADGTFDDDERTPTRLQEVRRAVKYCDMTPIDGAAALVNLEQRAQRFLWHRFGHPGTEGGPHASRVVRAKSPHRLDAERRLESAFGGDMLAMVESLRTGDHDAHSE